MAAHEISASKWTLFNMDKPAASKKYLKIHVVQYIKSISNLLKYYPSILLSSEQSGAVDMASKYRLASILSIYIYHLARTEDADTIMDGLQFGSASIYAHELHREPKLMYACTSHGGKTGLCIMGWLLFGRVKTNCSIDSF